MVAFTNDLTIRKQFELMSLMALHSTGRTYIFFAIDATEFSLHVDALRFTKRYEMVDSVILVLDLHKNYLIENKRGYENKLTLYR